MPVVKLPREDEDPLFVDLETVVVPLDDFVKAVIVKRPFGRFGLDSCRKSEEGKEYPNTGNEPVIGPPLK